MQGILLTIFVGGPRVGTAQWFKEIVVGAELLKRGSKFWFLPPQIFDNDSAKSGAEMSSSSAKGPRQKPSKSVKRNLDIFRRFSRRQRTPKVVQKCQKQILLLFDNDRAAPIFRHPFRGL